MNILKLLIVLVATGTLMTSCVSKKKLAEANANLKLMENAKLDCETAAAKTQVQLKKLKDQVGGLQTQVDSFKQVLGSQPKDGGQLISTLKSMEILSPAQAEGIEQSLAAISASGGTKEQLQATMINNLKSAIGVANDTDVNVASDKGNLYIDITDHMFFNSGSADLTDRAKMVIGKVAKILNAYPDMAFMIEGHTDNKPMHSACTPDNWDLSIRRATAVVRLLQKQHGIKPERMTAAGRGEYDPIQPNDTPAHRAENRRITIVIMPQLDQFFKLLVKK
jgi:chemotaxis protein MotB